MQEHREQISFVKRKECYSVWESPFSLTCFDQEVRMGCPFSEDADSFERKQEIYMNASNELQRTKDKVQQLQVNVIYSPFVKVQN